MWVLGVTRSPGDHSTSRAQPAVAAGTRACSSTFKSREVVPRSSVHRARPGRASARASEVEPDGHAEQRVEVLERDGGNGKKRSRSRRRASAALHPSSRCVRVSASIDDARVRAAVSLPGTRRSCRLSRDHARKIGRRKSPQPRRTPRRTRRSRPRTTGYAHLDEAPGERRRAERGRSRPSGRERPNSLATSSRPIEGRPGDRVGLLDVPLRRLSTAAPNSATSLTSIMPSVRAEILMERAWPSSPAPVAGSSA